MLWHKGAYYMSVIRDTNLAITYTYESINIHFFSQTTESKVSIVLGHTEN